MREDVRSEVGYVAPIEGLRGVAVLWVVLFHYLVVREKLFDDPWIATVSASRPLEAVIRNGYLGVDLFFLISGFLLTLPWFVHARLGRPAPATYAFYERRFWRIAPAYYLQLALLFVLVMPLLFGWMYWRRDLFVYAFNAVTHMAFVHNTTPLTSGSMGVNGALWTLAIEAQYYVLVPFVAPLFVRRPWTMLAAAFAAAVLWRLGARHDLDALVAFELAIGRHWQWGEEVVRHLLRTQLPSYLGHFALGIVLGRGWLAWRDRPRAKRDGVLLASGAMLAIAAILWTLLRGAPLLGDHAWILLTFALGTLLFAAAADRSGIADALLGRGPLAFVGRVSYSAYLYHLPLLLLWNKLAAGLPAASSFPLYLALVLAISWLSWRHVERPFLRMTVSDPEVRRGPQPAAGSDTELRNDGV
jgi:peptidoglycan/LPS O-acetylase OafA/YrhL